MLARRRRARLQAQPAGPRTAWQPQLAARRHRPRHLATRSTSRSCGASTRSRARATTECSWATSTTGRTSPIAYSSMFENSHADGIIVMGDIDGGEATLDLLAEKHRFVVGVTDRTTRRQIPGVYADSVAGTRLALEHLWALGHRSIICVSDDRTYDGRLRIDLYERFMRERGAGDRIRVFITDQEPAPAFELGPADVRGLGGAVAADGDLRHLRHHRDRPDAGRVPGRHPIPERCRSSATTTSTSRRSRSRHSRRSARAGWRWGGHPPSCCSR